jgi:DNA invertase Pin-like site-specific DNA recombinase
MLADARDGKFSHLAIYSIDHLERSTDETLATVQELISLGIEIIVADSPNLEAGTPSGSLLLGIRAMVAQYEVDMFRQRAKDTKRMILMSGDWPAGLSQRRSSR